MSTAQESGEVWSGAQNSYRRAPQTRSSAVGKMVSSGGGVTVPLGRARKALNAERYSFPFLAGVRRSCTLPPTCGIDIHWIGPGIRDLFILVLLRMVYARLTIRDELPFPHQNVPSLMYLHGPERTLTPIMAAGSSPSSMHFLPLNVRSTAVALHTTKRSEPTSSIQDTNDVPSALCRHARMRSPSDSLMQTIPNKRFH